MFFFLFFFTKLVAKERAARVYLLHTMRYKTTLVGQKGFLYDIFNFILIDQCLNFLSIRRSLTTINMPNLEPTGISRDDGQTPDRMLLIPWTNRRALVWDPTCVDTLAPSYPIFPKVQGMPKLRPMLQRDTKYSHLSCIYHFVAFGVETLGP